MRSSLLLMFGSVILLCASLQADDWPQWLGPQRDGIWHESGILEKFPTTGPVERWRVKIGSGYAGPAVANGRVFVTDRQLAKGVAAPRDPFAKSVIAGTERVLCLQEADGKLVWQYEYDCPYSVSYPAGPRTTPVIDGDRVYTLGAEGDLKCLDATDGKVIWSRNFKEDYKIPAPLWGFAGHPLIDGNKLICLAGGQGSVAVAFDKKTGKELWRALTAKEPGYAPPMIFQAGGKRQLIIWHPESINSLNPETGSVYWTQPFESRNGLSVSTPRQMDDYLFLTTFYNGSLMLRLDSNKPGAAVVWRSKKVSEKDTDGLHSIMSTPFLEDGYIYGVCSYGQLRGLRAETGERLWETLKATTPNNKETRWANAFIVKNGPRFFLSNEKGVLIIAKLGPAGYEEISRMHLLVPDNSAPGREVVWSHPAFANRSVYARNDHEIVCVSLNKTSESQ